MMTLDNNQQIISNEKATLLKSKYLMELFPFSDSDFSKISNKNLFINFKFKSKITNCNFTELNIKNASFKEEIYDTNFISSHLKNCIFIGNKNEKIIIEKSKFKKSDLSETNLKFIKFVNCDLSCSNLKYGFLQECEFINCLFHHTNFSYTIFSDCKFHSCKILFSDFEESKLENVKFKDSILIDVNFCKLKEPQIILDGGIFYDPKNSNEFVNLRSKGKIQLKNRPYFKTETDGFRFKKESKFKIEPLKVG